MPRPGIEICFNNSEDRFPLPASVRSAYGPLGFPPPPPGRPHICANFAQSLDGLVSFRDVPGQTGGDRVARSAVDQWLARMLRAHQDAILLGAGTLRAEAGPRGRGFAYAALPRRWREYRRALGWAPLRAVVLTRSGRLEPRHRLFAAAGPPPLIATTEAGARRLRRLRGLRAEILIPNPGAAVQAHALAALLRRDWGIRYLLCEAGPDVYAQWVAAQLVQEDFRTIALQVTGQAPAGAPARPTAYGTLSFLPATAPWFRLVSLHLARPSHLFLRIRRRQPPP
ncbi:MAG: dihydrofolate reductase family protein [Terriglobales bacterium]